MRGVGRSATLRCLPFAQSASSASFLPTPLIRLGAARQSTFSHKGRRKRGAFHRHHARLSPSGHCQRTLLILRGVVGSGARGQRLPNFYTWRELRAPPVIFQPPVSQPADLPTCVGGLPCQRERYTAPRARLSGQSWKLWTTFRFRGHVSRFPGTPVPPRKSPS
jgi:hypothetical protein